MAELPPTRREALRMATTAAVGAAALWLLSSCTSDSAPVQPPATAYLQTSLSSETYARTGERLGDAMQRIGHIPLAFAPFDQSSARIRAPSLNPELKRLVSSASKRADLAISLGSSSIQAEPWKSGIANPQRFSASVEAARRQIEDVFQRPTHVDIDCEDVVPAAQFAQLVHRVRDTLPADRQLSLTLPAAGNTIQNFNPRLLGDAPQLYRVMAYDWYGPWSTKTGPVASGPWDMRAVSRWINAFGDQKKISVGYPAYGYAYKGAHGPGESFNPKLVRSVPYADVPAGAAMHDDATNLTSETAFDNSWASFLSPSVIGRIATNLTHDYPHLNGSFFWAMDGLTPAHLDAINARAT